MSDNELEFSSNFRISMVTSDPSAELRVNCVCGSPIYSSVGHPNGVPIPLAAVIDGAEDHEAQGCRR